MRRNRMVPVALAVMASSGHLAYPAWLAVASRRHPRPVPPPDPPHWPDLTAVVPAFREAGVIAAKVADLRANGYPGSLRVVVVADGDDETAHRARRAGADVVAPTQRLGKAQALNLALEHVRSPIVVLTDANNRLRHGSLAALARPFTDPRVGAVAGDKGEPDAGEGLYWRFESWLKAHEWRLGSTIGLIGELAAVRTDAWQPIPADVATDDLWLALDLNDRGYRIAYEPRAMAQEPTAASLGQQWERRTRSVAGALHIFRRRFRQLGPAGGTFAVQIWGHRLGRYTVAPAAHVALIVWAAIGARRQLLARAVLAAHLLGAGVLAGRHSRLHAHMPLPLVAAEEVLVLQAVAVGGVVRYLRGDRRTMWPRVER